MNNETSPLLDGQSSGSIIEAARTDKKPRTWLGLLGVVIMLSGPMLQVLFGPWLLSTFGFPMDRFMSLWVMWISAGLALAISVFGEGIPLATFGFKISQKTLRARLIEWILTVVAAVAVGAVMIFFSTTVRQMLTGEPLPPVDLSRFPAWVLIPAWFTSMLEEVQFRGYPIERLSMIVKKPWIAGIITCAAFVLQHLFAWDWIHVLTIVLPGGVLMTVLYLWRRNLAMVVIIHAILNVPLLIAPLVIRFM